MTNLESVLRSRERYHNDQYPYLIMPRDIERNDFEQMIDWLKANCDGKFSVRNINKSCSFRFTDQEDFMLFSMRWL